MQNDRTGCLVIKSCLDLAATKCNFLKKKKTGKLEHFIMDLHSYAKRRRSTKTWTRVQKRKLLESRIAFDRLFKKYPQMSLVPWKKFLNLADLNDFNTLFVRKQWLAMIAKYKRVKRNRVGDIPSMAIDKTMIERLTEDWEFFAPIHRFMLYKTANLHSYALEGPEYLPISKQETSVAANTCQQIIEPSSPEAHQHVTATSASTSSSSSDLMSMLCSSDTNEDFAAAIGVRNDHYFYSKRWSFNDHFAISEEIPNSDVQYFDDVWQRSADTPPGLPDEDLLNYAREEIAETTTTTARIDFRTVDAEQILDTCPLDENYQSPLKTERQQPAKHKTATLKADKADVKCHCCSNHRNLNEKSSNALASFYRHKRRYNHRQERRFDAVLGVFGQLIRTYYPNVDISALENTPGADVSSSSDEE